LRLRLLYVLRRGGELEYMFKVVNRYVCIRGPFVLRHAEILAADAIRDYLLTGGKPLAGTVRGSRVVMVDYEKRHVKLENGRVLGFDAYP
jgi:hypothetical protein